MVALVQRLRAQALEADGLVGGVQAGYLYLIAESDAQARSDDARQPNARLRERSYRVEVYLARGARYAQLFTLQAEGYQ